MKAAGPPRDGEPEIRAVLLDVEGTTTSISFVRERLFPLARHGLRAFVRTRAGEPAVAALLEEVTRLAREEGSAQASAIDPLDVLERWMDADRKVTPLKALQGLLWEEAYRAGTLLGHVYDDVPGALRAWRARGLRLLVFSSGSVQAQRSLFAHTAAGDLTTLFEGWFDTNVGPKTDPASYAEIARRQDLAPAEILFLSDSEAELDAAHAAGLRTVAVDRGERRLGAHPLATRLDALPFPPPSEHAGGDALWAAKAGVAALARRCHARGWAEATSGNFSARLADGRIAVTRSGLDKEGATPADVLLVDREGLSLEAGRPSAETPLHCALYRWSDGIGAVAHTHSLAATVVSRRALAAGALRLRGYEIAKAFSGVATHETEVTLPVVENCQDAAALARAVTSRLDEVPTPIGYLVAGHGLTTWGVDLVAVRRHLEALELLLACAGAERPGD